MTRALLTFSIFRILLPVLIAICVLFRPSVLSGIYLMFLYYHPYVEMPTMTTLAGHTGIYLKVMMVVSALTTLLQVAFQVFLMVESPYGNMLHNCDLLERILRTIGLVKLNNKLLLPTVLEWTYPEPLMLFTSLATYWCCKKLVHENPNDLESMVVTPKRNTDEKFISLLTSIGRYAVLVTMCLAAIIRPSVLGGLYFVVFLSSATWWSCYKKLERKFAILIRCMMVVVIVHMTTLYFYQTQWPQDYLPQTDLIARLFGLVQFMSYDCKDPRITIWVKQTWDIYAYPLALYQFYMMCIYESRLLMKPQLMKGMNSSKIYGSGGRKSSLIQDSVGSVTVPSDAVEDIPMDQLDIAEESYNPTICENVMYVLEAILQVIIKSSYIGTNIIMMTWSITYLSWITFVLLLWANLIWLIPNQRKAMLRSSPFLLLYAWFLLLSAYIFCMDLTNSELPSSIQNVNLAQIGFVKITKFPFESLAVKCLFTTMFCITLRQYMQERVAQRQNSALADMVAPLQVTVDAAAGVEKQPETSTLDKIGQWFRTFMASIWIWIVATTLFFVSVTGQHMTGFRIVYMGLFLIFVITFQLSYRFWKKIIYGFWLTVIVYSMLMLILVYTYQFDHFPQYWISLGVPTERQEDIGLEHYETTQLFVRLVTPTFFIIITVIQLHYFHDDFMKIYEGASKEVNEIDDTRSNNEFREDESERRREHSSVKFNVSQIETISFREGRKKEILNSINYYWNLLFLFLEVHMVKLVLFTGILACIVQPCALDLIVVVLLILGTVLGKRMEPFAIYTCSLFFSALLLARMVYQIKYFRASAWDFNCSNGNDTNQTVNDADWLGFSKVDEDKSLMYLIRWDIIFIIVATFWTTVNIRQMNLRSRMGIPHARVEVMFPSITRADADKDLSNFFKYLMNYGFYKFGVEVCLLMMVVLIGFRMDLYALLYAFWLCGLFTLRRETLSSIWSVFIFFIAILIPFQYCMVIGLPPSLCIIFPWNTNDILQKFQQWAFLMDTFNALPAKKLICDYLLLVFVSRQAIGFKKEIQQRTMGLVYPGGSNEIIIQHSEDPNFENPVPDFITYCRSYLDVFKRAVLLSMLWLSLAVLFLAGTNRVNIFSIGYLIGAFVFLWTGTDMYLWPIPKILKRWNYMLVYIVFVITMKVGLQIVGCLFMEELTENVCWPVQLFAIGCVNKFKKSSSLISDNIDPKCEVPREYIGLVWDGLSFACLIMQKRIFHSYNFFHMIDEAKASTILASRGAELIEELRMKRMHEQEDNERVVLEKIKSKMDRIKASQQKIQGAVFSEPKTHHLAVRSGDYYMFDDLHVEDLDPLDALPVKSSLADDINDDEEDEYEGGYTVGEFLSTAMKTNIGSTVRRASLNADQAKRRSSARTLVSASISRADEPVRSVKINEFPQASTSQDEGMSEFIDPDEDLSEDVQRTNCQKLKDLFVFIYYFLDSVMISATKILNSYTRDYRYVLKVLRREKKNLKEFTDYSVGRRIGRSQVWEPSGSFHELTALQSKSISLFKILEEEEAEMSSYDQPSVLKFLLALWYIVTSKSELMCYLIIFLNQIQSATFLSLALPLMVFLWGTLTMPRPTKTFWVSIIAYTEVIVLIKCMFQFEIIPWNRKAEVVNDPFYPPRIIGIERKHNYALWDLLLLLVVFFHRFMLKSMGLWQATAPTQKTIPGFYKINEDGNITHLRGRRKNSRAERTLMSLNKRLETVLKEIDLTGNDVETDLVGFRRRSTFLHRLFHNFRMFGDMPETSIYSDYAQEDELKDEINMSKGGSSEAGMGKLPEMEDLNSLVKITTDKIDPVDNLTETLKMAATEYIDLFKTFFSQLIQPTSRVAADVYSYMFLCDFFNFFVLLLGYTSFGTNQGDGGGVTTYLEDNKIPVLFLLMLILQFMLIIIDRGIYLRKNLVLKIIFQYFLIIFLHLWLFVLYPTITERSFNSVLPPQMYYMIKCFYLLLSAYQIRCGYPNRILGNFLCKGYNYVNMFLFKGFLAVPFLFELRTVMDWMWTDTSMTVFDWIKMEDIFAHIFQLKCQRYLEAEYPQPRGEKKANYVKYFMGGLILMLIIGIIWFPLVFFSLGNAVGQPNIPFDVSMDLRIGPYDPVYQMSAQDNNIYQFDTSDYNDMLDTYDTNRGALTFITNYEAADIAAVKLSSDSSNVWTISPPDRKRMIDEVQSNNSLVIRLNYKVSHKTSKSEDSGILTNSVKITLNAFEPNGQRNPARTNLSLLLDTDGNVSAPVLLEQILPKFLKVTNNGVVKPVGSLMKHIQEGDNANFFRNATLNLHHIPGMGPQSDWWKMNETCNDRNYKKYLSHLPHQDCDSIVVYIFNDKIFPAGLSLITGGGIIGLYMVYFFMIFKIMRNVMTNGLKKIQAIWYEDIPNPDRIYVMLNYIYILRSYRLYDAEELAYARLIFLMRSRELCIKMTRIAGDPYDPNFMTAQHQSIRRGYSSPDDSERYLY